MVLVERLGMAAGGKNAEANCDDDQPSAPKVYINKLGISGTVRS